MTSEKECFSIKDIDAKSVAIMVERCLGHVNAIGETNYDNASLENLKKYFEVLDILLDDVQLLIPDSKSPAFSVANIGCAAIGYLAALKDSIAGWLEQRW